MKKILCIGGEAHGRSVMDLGAKAMRLAASPPSFLNTPENGVDKLTKLEDGYSRHAFTHHGWPSVVMLCDTLRPEDMELWTRGLEIPTAVEND